MTILIFEFIKLIKCQIFKIQYFLFYLNRTMLLNFFWRSWKVDTTVKMLMEYCSTWFQNSWYYTHMQMHSASYCCYFVHNLDYIEFMLCDFIVLIWSISIIFWKDRSTTQQILIMRLPVLAEKDWRQNKTIYISFIDIRKAFDTVEHEVIWSTLNSWGRHQSYSGTAKHV